MAVVRWRFVDTVTAEEYTFEMNPHEGGTPAYERNLNVQRTTAGGILVFEGPAAPQTLNFSGTILSQAHLDAFISWFQNQHVLQLIDDLGRTFEVIIQSFQPQRVRSALYPWKHTYSMTAQVLA